MKNCKVIVHSKKNDENLTYLYRNKRVSEWAGEIDKISDSERYQPLLTLQPLPAYHPRSAVSVSPVQQQPPRSLHLPRLVDNESMSSDNTSSSNNSLPARLAANETWRDRFNQFYNHLEVTSSDSYRKSYKVTFNAPSTSPTLPSLNNSKNRRTNRK
jgi:hypothetical protein